MRPVHKMAVTLCVAALSVGLVFGQQFRGGGGGTSNPVSLLQRAEVKKELNLTDEQVAKLPDAAWKALAAVLDAKQAKRLRQIELQQRGADAFKDAQVQSALKLSDAQKTSIKEALTASADQVKEALAGAKGGGFKGTGEKLTTIRKETMEKITGLLNSEQKEAWTAMLGDEFKLTTGFGKGNFGKGNFGKGKGKKKKDTE